jgi:hypothetical protein
MGHAKVFSRDKKYGMWGVAQLSSTCAAYSSLEFDPQHQKKKEKRGEGKRRSTGRKRKERK